MSKQLIAWGYRGYDLRMFAIISDCESMYCVIFDSSPIHVSCEQA